MAQQCYHSPLPAPLFNVEFGKPPFLGKRFGVSYNIELGGRWAFISVVLFAHKVALTLNFLDSFVHTHYKQTLSPRLQHLSSSLRCANVFKAATLVAFPRSNMVSRTT